jgi:hypothetical protein
MCWWNLLTEIFSHLKILFQTDQYNQADRVTFQIPVMEK